MEHVEFIRFAKLLNAMGVRYMVVGGFAVNHYGYKRTTSDIDLYIKDALENRRALLEALDKMGYGRMEELLTVPMLAGYCEIMMDDGFYVDLMTSIPGLDAERYDEQYKRIQFSTIDGVEIPYINYNDLLENKRATARPKDIDDYDNLEKLRS